MATKYQLRLLRFLAYKLRKQIPPRLGEDGAGELIHAWLNESPEQQTLTHEFERAKDSAREISFRLDDPDWRTMHMLKVVNPELVFDIVYEIGPRETHEPEHEYLDRAVDHIRATRPELRRTGRRRGPRRAVAKGGGCLAIAVMLIVPSGWLLLRVFT